MNLLHWLLLILVAGSVFAAAGHALLHKRDPRAALGWIGVCFLYPLAGPLLYFLFGINRVRTRAKKLGRKRVPFHAKVRYTEPSGEGPVEVWHSDLPDELKEIARISDTILQRPLLRGNTVEVLHNGEQAYPRMLQAIEEAQQTLFLSTYIFDTNFTGLQFIDALSRAQRRGVDVRVIIDGIGECYSWPHASVLLQERGVKVARFLPPSIVPPAIHINLRNHRKLLIVDRCVGFVGGMNIGDRHLAEQRRNARRVIDIHFRLTGPVISQIEEAFLEDWAFSYGELTVLPPASVPPTGDTVCRTIVDGPNDELDRLAFIFAGTISCARRRVTIMNPYFLPSREIMAALQAAALRGVNVSVILPARNNLPFVHWATRNLLYELMEMGVHVYYQKPPFVHSKVFVVDDHYGQIGSVNIDPRSLHLNFELAVEVYGSAVASLLTPHLDEALRNARELTAEEIEDRSWVAKFRDAAAWLFSPYL